MREDKMVGWQHQLNRYESEQALRDGEVQCRSPWGHKKSSTTE